MTIVVLRAGDPVAEVAERHGTFFDWIASGLRSKWPGEVAEIDVRSDATMLDLEEVSGLVITGSSASVTERAPWMLRAEAYLRAAHAERVPMLGICFGHQLIGQALGGEVTKNPRGREIGTSRAKRTGVADRWLDGVADELLVNMSHVDTVVKLPEGAKVLLTTELEPHAAFAIGDHVRCVQFHPEFSGEIMRGYVRARAPRILEEGLDPDALHDGVQDTPDAFALLGLFAEHFVRRVAAAE